MRKLREQHSVDSVFALLAAAVFAACVLAVTLTGAGGYRRVTERDADSYARRTALQYVAEKVRQADAAGAVYAADFDGARPEDGGDTLFLTETIDGAAYETRIYCCDGFIRELFAEKDAPLSREDGERVLATGDLRFRCADGLLTVTVTAEDGSAAELTLSLRSGEPGKEAAA